MEGAGEGVTVDLLYVLEYAVLRGERQGGRSPSHLPMSCQITT